MNKSTPNDPEHISRILPRVMADMDSKLPTAKETVSHWECLKKLIARENIYADMEIQNIDFYFNSQLEKEINNR